MEVLSSTESQQIAYRVAVLVGRGWRLARLTNLWSKKGASMQHYSWEEGHDVTVTDFTLDEAWDQERDTND